MKAAVPDIHIVLLSAYAEFQYAQQAIHLGVEEYLVKPFSLHQLMERLRRALQVMQEKVTVQRARQRTNHRIRRLVVEQLLTSRSPYDEDTLQECAAILQGIFCRAVRCIVWHRSEWPYWRGSAPHPTGDSGSRLRQTRCDAI